MTPPEKAVLEILGPMTSREKVRRVVLGVLRSVREPTVAMVEAGFGEFESDDPTTPEIYIAMIDALILEAEG